MPKKPDVQLTKSGLHRLSSELDRLDSLPIVPVSDEEVADVELTYQPGQIDPARDARQRNEFEKLREEWLDSAEQLGSLLNRIDSLGMSRGEFVKRMRLDLEILLKLELRQIRDVPWQAVKRLAETLLVAFHSVHWYLSQPPESLEQMAASSKGKPVAAEVETWTEAIVNSSLNEEDRAYWLNMSQT